MKHISFSLKDKAAYKDALRESSKKKYKSKLIQVFTAITDEPQLIKILNKLSQDFNDALIVGATTAGEISNAKMMDNSTVISLSLFENTKLNSSYVNEINTKSGHKISQKIFSKNTKAVIVLSEGLKGEDYEGFIKGIKQENPEILLSGGLAGDNFKLVKTFVFYKNKILDEGAVAVSLSGKKLFADNRYNLNWTPIGKKFTITSSEGNVVHEIDGKSAYSVFEHYLGKNIFNNNATSLPDFPLLYTVGSTTVSRTALGVQGTSLVFAGPLKKGQEVQFGFSNASTVISGAYNISSQINKNPAQAIYVYSCIARKALLGKALEKEFANFDAIAPTSGFFTYGEFYSADKSNVLLNCTTTILILSEKNSIQKAQRNVNKINSQSLENITFSALTHFIEQTSSELKENLELLNQYKTAVDMTSLISKTDVNGLITYVNQNFCKTSGYSAEELIGKNHNIIKDTKMPNAVFKQLWKTISSSKVWKGVLSNRAKNNSIYYVDATIVPIFGKEGKIVEYMAIRQDITKQIQSKQRIKEKEELIKAIFDNQDSIVIYASKTKGMLNVNKKLFDYLNYTSVDVFKKEHTCICDLFLDEEGYTNPTKNPNWIEDIATATTSEDKAKILIKDGTIHIFKIIIKKMDDEYIINMYDITELENALHKAYASEQAKSTFLANMSHEIRTPLNGILGFTEILSRKDLDQDTKRYVEIMRKSGQTLLNVVNDILDFSKIESGELMLSTHEANLFEEMEAVVSAFSSTSKNKQIEYYTYIDTNIPKTLTCDIQRIKQVLNNLLSNAIKFTPAQGEVHVNISLEKIKNDSANIKFSVKDTGIGIPQNKLQLVFKSFSQADDSISRKYGGTGLGLAISSQFIQMMDSTLELSSQEGKGSEFYFTLKLPILDKNNAVSSILNSQQIQIRLFNSKDEKKSSINNIISTYLNAWNYSFENVYDWNQIDAQANILIVCEKLFEQEKCEKLLESFSNLEIIYIEGAQSNFNLKHERFHYLEQPMTGSALFNTIITLTDIKSEIKKIQPSEDQNKYNGNILIAEDNETNQILISILLRDKGLKFTIVNNGQEAVDTALRENDYDIIFMDINMPIMDGITATKLLRQNQYTKPIVSLSANVIDSDISSFKEAGIDNTLNKPIVPYELDKILDTYLKTSIFDTVNPELISTSLSINNLAVIEKLLVSFTLTAQTIVKKIESNTIDKDILHNIKGVAGNLRFTILYELVKELEVKLPQLNEKELQLKKELVLSHLKNLLKQINLIYK